jgi:hypothetical protein
MQKPVQWLLRNLRSPELMPNLLSFFDGVCLFSIAYFIGHNTVSYVNVRGASMSPVLNPPRPGKEHAFWKKDMCIQRRYFPSFNDVPQRGDVVVARCDLVLIYLSSLV